MQRALDVLLSFMALLVLSPLLVPIAIILRLSGEGEIFFFQERVGLEGRPIRLFKFATMLKDSPNIGTGTICQPVSGRNDSLMRSNDGTPPRPRSRRSSPSMNA